MILFYKLSQMKCNRDLFCVCVLLCLSLSFFNQINLNLWSFEVGTWKVGVDNRYPVLWLLPILTLGIKQKLTYYSKFSDIFRSNDLRWILSGTISGSVINVHNSPLVRSVIWGTYRKIYLGEKNIKFS